ncbi:MAG: hypothetical protein J0L70_29930 [Leptolyngbya sp. UWPOB_LEPTO1]|uniref:hypothetical protein n=1 Tax=Leptolyngbya sp. UWPOB_LEPTO1 TaxID=2815653 RepID=UPI001AC7A5B1|nr:hypothetical protein [Leptolyngbya sp. UWPOB_LEPTO1]MBN8564756.1 hypothetical protein [Leptolyngbya sp. UWPOB_LEPTO1]
MTCSAHLYNDVQFDPNEKARHFQFSDRLQERLESLLTDRKNRSLTPDEEAEMTDLMELNQILSFVNTKLAAELWQLSNAEE